MARPERNNVDYFPHPVHQGKKMGYIRKKYGHEGYSVWYQLVEQLGEANDHYLDLSKETSLMLLTGELMTTEETLLSIIDDLVKLEVFVAELWQQHRIIFSEAFVESIGDAYLKRKNKCITLQGLLHLLSDKLRSKPSILPLNTADNTQSKVKKSKVEKSVKKYSSDSAEMRLANLLHEKILTLVPKLKKPNFQVWARDMDLLMRIDGRSEQEVRDMIIFVNKHSFWSKNILSPNKLRVQFDRLTVEANNVKGNNTRHSPEITKKYANIG